MALKGDYRAQLKGNFAGFYEGTEGSDSVYRGEDDFGSTTFYGNGGDDDFFVAAGGAWFEGGAGADSLGTGWGGRHLCVPSNH